MKRVLIMIVIILGYFLINSSMEWWEEQMNKPVAQPSPFKKRSIEELRKAHRYHGIIGGYQKEDRIWYFKRDNKECRMFAYKEA